MAMAQPGKFRRSDLTEFLQRVLDRNEQIVAETSFKVDVVLDNLAYEIKLDMSNH